MANIKKSANKKMRVSAKPKNAKGIKTSLTSEELALIPVVREEWLATFMGARFDKAVAKKLVNFVYEMSGLKSPEFIVCRSPMECQYAANLFPDIVPKDGNWTQAKKDAGNPKMNYVPFANYLTAFDYGHMAFYDYFARIGCLNNPTTKKGAKAIKDMKVFAALSKKAGVWISILLKDVAFVSKPPLFFLRDGDGKLHSLEGPAVRFEDGYEIYVIHGVKIRPSAFKTIFGPLGSDADKTEARDAAAKAMASLSDEQREAVKKGLEEIAAKKAKPEWEWERGADLELHKKKVRSNRE